MNEVNNRCLEVTCPVLRELWGFGNGAELTEAGEAARARGQHQLVPAACAMPALPNINERGL
eukprot:3557604-Amphidinium_carterae.1